MESLKNFVKYKAPNPSLTIIDISNRELVVLEGEIETDSVNALIDGFLDGTIEKRTF